MNKVITLVNPPVNALSFKYSEKLLKEIEDAEKDSSVTSVTITGANGFFSAGVDVNDFQKVWDPSGTTVRDIIEAIERSDKMFIAAIDGIALGGALELALACDRRIATPRSKLGLPEIKLGLIPGAGGTQRLPRLIAPQEALTMMLKGETVNAERALELGLIDVIVSSSNDPEQLAVSEHVEGPPKKRRVSEMNVQLPATAQAFALPYIIAEAHKTVPPEERGGLAAHKLIDAVQAAFELPFPRGLAREYRLFDELVASAPSLALRHLFFAERELSKIPGLPPAEPVDIKTAGVIGGGTMGTGIAIAFANAGIPVTIVEPNADQIGKSRQTIFGMFMHQVKRGRMTQEEAWKRGQSIAFSGDFTAVADCDLVIEAVFENMAVKKDVFGKLDPIVKPGAIVASNTSTLDIDEMAAVTKRPQQFLGLHFFAPANIMKLLEIVRGKETSAQTLATAFKLAKQLRKVAVLSANAFGFIGNRMFFEYTREAVALAEEGVPPARIDAAMKKFGMAMGPFATFDLSGIDVFWHVAQGRPDLELARTPILDRLYEQKRLGQKTGKGFYTYAEGSREAIRDEEIERLFAELAKEAGVKQNPDVSDEEIASRIVAALITSGEEILREGVAMRPGDIDIVWIYGYGFPPYRGGPMFYSQEEVAHA
ncbi:MAG TPA: 3-hydroxyacyl-CoA dehydrogenase NAD-binding domain-containing protein [Candidatus Rubrimentiphilum sp.]|nr:3-hydroxyacyl-CoA dehydrogenase NAD-binding domain-containing protein [Candidatus Rubrimentiphilum sp.]